jgi:hypothetical protein
VRETLGKPRVKRRRCGQDLIFTFTSQEANTQRFPIRRQKEKRGTEKWSLEITRHPVTCSCIISFSFFFLSARVAREEMDRTALPSTWHEQSRPGGSGGGGGEGRVGADGEAIVDEVAATKPQYVRKRRRAPSPSSVRFGSILFPSLPQGIKGRGRQESPADGCSGIARATGRRRRKRGGQTTAPVALPRRLPQRTWAASVALRPPPESPSMSRSLR